MGGGGSSCAESANGKVRRCGGGLVRVRVRVCGGCACRGMAESECASLHFSSFCGLIHALWAGCQLTSLSLRADQPSQLVPSIVYYQRASVY